MPCVSQLDPPLLPCGARAEAPAPSWHPWCSRQTQQPGEGRPWPVLQRARRAAPRAEKGSITARVGRGDQTMYTLYCTLSRATKGRLATTSYFCIYPGTGYRERLVALYIYILIYTVPSVFRTRYYRYVHMYICTCT